MKIYLINLDRAQDRRDYMLSELARLMPGVPVERALCVDIRSPNWTPPADWKPGRWRSERWNLPPSDIEIFRSHMDCWTRISACGQPGLILEDDLLFSKAFPEAVSQLIANKPSGIVRLDGVSVKLLLDAPRTIGDGYSLSRLRSAAPSCAAYFLDPETAFALSQSAKIDRHVDDFLFDPVFASEDQHGHGLSAFQLEPVVCVQGQFGDFSTTDRKAPSFLRETKRVDSTRRRDPRYVGPLAYRVWKELMRLGRRIKKARLLKKVRNAGGRIAEPELSKDLTWV